MSPTKIAAASAICLLLLAACKQSNSPYSLQSPAGENSRLPYLFTDKAGVTWLSWVEESASEARLMVASTNGKSWSEPVQIAASENWFINWADYPMIASDGKGNLVAHVLEKTSPEKFDYRVRIYSSDDGGLTWPTEFLLNTDTVSGEHGFVSLQPTNTDGIWFMAWLDGRNASSGHDGHHGSMSLRAAIVHGKGTAREEWEVDGKTCDCCQTTATWTKDGPIIAYRDRSDDEVRDISVRRFVNNTWSEPVSPGNDQWKINGCPVNGPRLAASGNKIAIAWFTAGNDNPRVQAAISADGGATFGKPILIKEGNTEGRVDITALEGNRFALCWMEEGEIKIATIGTDSAKSESSSIGITSADRSSGFPQLETMGKKLILAWTDTKEKRVLTRVIEP